MCCSFVHGRADFSSSSPLTRVRSAAFEELLLLVIIYSESLREYFLPSGVTTDTGAGKIRHGDRHEFMHART